MAYHSSCRPEEGGRKPATLGSTVPRAPSAQKVSTVVCTSARVVWYISARAALEVAYNQKQKQGADGARPASSPLLAPRRGFSISRRERLGRRLGAAGRRPGDLAGPFGRAAAVDDASYGNCSIFILGAAGRVRRG